MDCVAHVGHHNSSRSPAELVDLVTTIPGTQGTVVVATATDLGHLLMQII